MAVYTSGVTVAMIDKMVVIRPGVYWWGVGIKNAGKL